jgi:hypothetical protein
MIRLVFHDRVFAATRRTFSDTALDKWTPLRGSPSGMRMAARAWHADVG